MEKFKVTLVIVIASILMIIGLVFFNHISKQYAEDKNKVKDDYSDVTNVPIIDAKLGSDIEITQPYLMKYTINKIGIWYLSEGYVSKVKSTDKSTIYTITSKDKKYKVEGSIGKDNDVYKKGDYVYFVGAINLSSGSLNMSMISNEKISLSTPEQVKIEDLAQHIEEIRTTEFIVQGYMVTDNEEYKLFESKTEYKKDAQAGNYFLLEMDKSFNYTGNAFVKLRCNINGTYNLNNCMLEE